MKHLFIIPLFILTQQVYAQDSIQYNYVESEYPQLIYEADSISSIKDDSLSIEPDKSIYHHEMDLIRDSLLIGIRAKNLLSADQDIKHSLSPNLNLQYISPSLNYIETEYLTTTPYAYSFYNWREGGDMMGINNHINISDNFWVDLNVYVSSSYATPLQPERYNNASVSLRTSYQIDRVRITVYGQMSLREGINPWLDPSINGGNYYGGEISFRVYKNIGFSFGIKNSYYRNNWHTFKYMGPTVF